MPASKPCHKHFIGYDFPEYRKVAKEYGVDHFLSKDALTGAEIAAMVGAVIEKRKGIDRIPNRIRGILHKKSFDK
jgi:hypothetical protein